MKAELIEKAYAVAKDRYAAIGVDTDAALDQRAFAVPGEGVRPGGVFALKAVGRVDGIRIEGVRTVRDLYSLLT